MKIALSDDRQYRLLVHAVTDYAIYMLDIVGVVTSWNAGAQRFKGYEASEIIGQHFSCFYTDEDKKMGLPHLALNIAASKGRFEAEGWRVRKDGSHFWAHVVIDPVFDETGTLVGFAKVTRDITAKRESETSLELARVALFQSQEAALVQSRASLFQSHKMEAVGQLTGGIAHDFNNMLAGISGCLELLQTRVNQGRVDDLARYLVTAQTSVKRAASLTHRLLAFSRQQPLSSKATNVNRLMAGMEDLIHQTIGPSISVEAVGAVELWNTLADPNQLENVLLNLCINARDAMPRGGRLTIETANRWLDEPAARSRDMPPGQYVSLCVSDTGTGMTPEVIRRAVDPFFTTKPEGQGTGLGLSMIHGFAKQSGGQVRIYSELGQGSTVCIYLPRHRGDAESEAEPIGLQQPLRTGMGETVLVVDDEATVRMLISEVLAEMGLGTIEAADGPAALKVLKSDTRVDLLITDIGLPGGMNGRQMVDAAHKFRPNLKVLFITGYAENAVIGNGILEPDMHLVTKPFALEHLAHRVRDIIL